MAIVTRGGKGSELSHAELDNNFVELDKIPNGKAFPKESNIGIKIDVDNPDFGWGDIVGTIISAHGTSAENAYIGGIKQTQFAEEEDAYVSFHMPHEYVPGTELFLHVHWSHNSAVVTGGTVTWAFEVTYSKGHNQAEFNIPVIVSIVDAASNLQYHHRIAETVATTPGGGPTLLDTNLIEVDGILLCRLYLDSNDIVTSDASVVNPFVHFVDVHYRSSGIPTKEKSPNFYGGI